MDPALPPSGLDRIFKQYDAIRSHGTASDTPPWEPEDEQQRQQASEPAEAAQEPLQETSAPPTKLTGFITPLAADGRVTVEGFAPPQKILTDGTRPRPVGRPKSWTEDADTKKREEEAARLQKFNSDYSNRGTF